MNRKEIEQIMMTAEVTALHPLWDKMLEVIEDAVPQQGNWTFTNRHGIKLTFARDQIIEQIFRDSLDRWSDLKVITEDMTSSEIVKTVYTASVRAALNNRIAEEGCDRCFCGCKYWENDRCIDCGQGIEAVIHHRNKINQ